MKEDEGWRRMRVSVGGGGKKKRRRIENRSVNNVNVLLCF